MKNKIIHILLLFLFMGSFINAQVVLLKDNSAIKGQVILNTKQEIQVIILNGDTLTIHPSYVDKVMVKETYEERYLKQGLIPHHKKEGLFVNIELLAHPFAISAGKRLNSNWNVGGTVFYGSVHSDDNIGVAPYARYYFGKNLFNHYRFFADAFLGVAKRKQRFFSRAINDYPLTGSVAVGIQLPKLKKLNPYFKLGFFFSHDKVERLSFDSNSIITEEYTMNATIQLSLIAIQF